MTFGDKGIDDTIDDIDVTDSQGKMTAFLIELFLQAVESVDVCGLVDFCSLGKLLWFTLLAGLLISVLPKSLRFVDKELI